MEPTNLQNIHPIIKSILQNRGLKESDMELFFSWDLNSLPDLTKLHDLDEASSVIVSAIKENKKIGVFGDYDVDGTTSCALLYHFFKMLKVSIEIIQPDRILEGYGLHRSSIDQALLKNIEILITVDCGITNHDAALYAKEKGLVLIITDHHKDDDTNELPSALIINPNRRDEPPYSPLRNLAGVGVAFSLALSIKKKLESLGEKCPSIYTLLQMVAIGTISDLAFIDTVNQRLVRHGLKQIVKTSHVGLKKFLDKEIKQMEFLPSEHISFNIGPMINSKGRLDHPQKALELLITDDADTAFINYNHLELCNNERKRIQNDIFEEAKSQIQKEMSGEDIGINICYSPKWHEGVIGVVASKLVEEFSLPVIILTDSSDPYVLKASVRTAGQLNIFECLKECSDLFNKFGGHKSAAGFSMNKSHINTLKERIKTIVLKYPAILRTNKLDFDYDIKLSEINPTLLKNLDMMEPFGNGNLRPLFRSTTVKLHSYEILKEKHVRFELGCLKDNTIKLRGISFNYIGSWNNPHPEKLYKEQQKNQIPLWAYFNLGINRWNGNQFIQLQIKKINTGF